MNEIIEIKKETELSQNGETVILEVGDKIRVIKESSLPDWLAREYQERAEAERQAGGNINIDWRLPSIDIKLSDGSEYFFQEWQVEELLDEYEIPDNITAEDFLLAIAQEW